MDGSSYNIYNSNINQSGELYDEGEDEELNNSSNSFLFGHKKLFKVAK